MRNEKDTKIPEFLMLGEFRYEISAGIVKDSKGKILHMRRQSAEVLALLALKAGQVVSKDQIIESVWQGVVTTDDSLIQCIADIRRAVGREVIETFPKKGYRLRVSPIELTPTSTRGNVHKELWLGALAVLFVLAILSLTIPSKDVQDAFVPPIVQRGKTLAVLPFANLGGDSKIRYFSDRLSEDLTTGLSKVPGLTVISYASSRDYPEAESDFSSIAQELGVRYLVRGTVRHNAEMVRINVAMVDPVNGFNIWTDLYDRPRSNPFDVQEEVTRQIVHALSMSLGAEAAPQRIEPDAYYMLLRGLVPLRELTAIGNADARAYFERALALDPQYARAHASIAVTYGRESALQNWNQHVDVSIEKGLKAAITAIQLDPEIPHAYFALGLLNLSIREYDNALAAVRHALRLNENYSEGYALLAEVSMYGGDLIEALRAIKRAKLLHPHHPVSYHRIEGQILYQLGQFDDAQPLLEEAAERVPKFYQGLISLAANYGQQGNTEAASLLLLKVQELKPDSEVMTLASQRPYRLHTRRKALIAGLQKANR